MVFYGASGHAKVIIEAWVASGGTVKGILDDNKEIKMLLGYPVSGPYSADKFPDETFILAIGSNPVRKSLSIKVPRSFGKVIHPLSILSKSALVGDGSVLMAGSIINSETKIGKHVIINTGATVDHDCTLGDYVHVSPQVTLCGGISIGEGSHIGAGAVVVENITIGSWATIGAGSVITRPVPDYAVVVGAPGKIIRMNSPVF